MLLFQAQPSGVGFQVPLIVGGALMCRLDQQIVHARVHIVGVQRILPGGLVVIQQGARIGRLRVALQQLCQRADIGDRSAVKQARRLRLEFIGVFL